MKIFCSDWPYFIRNHFLPPLPISNRLFAHVRNFYLTWPCIGPLVLGTIHVKVREKEFIISQSIQDREIRNFIQGLSLVPSWNSYPSVRFPYPAWQLMMDSYSLFCFCILFSNIYPKIKFTAKNWSDLYKVKWFFFIFLLENIFYFSVLNLNFKRKSFGYIL